MATPQDIHEEALRLVNEFALSQSGSIKYEEALRDAWVLLQVIAEHPSLITDWVEQINAAQACLRQALKTNSFQGVSEALEQAQHILQEMTQ